jgi:hypothetical protein
LDVFSHSEFPERDISVAVQKSTFCFFLSTAKTVLRTEGVSPTQPSVSVTCPPSGASESGQVEMLGFGKMVVVSARTNKKHHHQYAKVSLI